MSQYFINRLIQGYAGEKKKVSTFCLLPWCNNSSSKYKGVGTQCCEQHQSLMREYGGPARIDRKYTFNKQKECSMCGYNPWEHNPLIQMISDDLIRDRTAWGQLIVDHIVPKKYEGTDHPDNCQTLCGNCNQVKTTLSFDSMPKSLYKSKEDYETAKSKIQEQYELVFGKID